MIDDDDDRRNWLQVARMIAAGAHSYALDLLEQAARSAHLRGRSVVEYSDVDQTWPFSALQY